MYIHKHKEVDLSTLQPWLTLRQIFLAVNIFHSRKQDGDFFSFFAFFSLPSYPDFSHPVPSRPARPVLAIISHNWVERMKLFVFVGKIFEKAVSWLEDCSFNSFIVWHLLRFLRHKAHCHCMFCLISSSPRQTVKSVCPRIKFISNGYTYGGSIGYGFFFSHCIKRNIYIFKD